MRIQVEVLVSCRGGRSRKVIHHIERDMEGGGPEEGIGLGLGDMKAVVAGLQRVVVDEQGRDLIELRSRCVSCRPGLGHKGASVSCPNIQTFASRFVESGLPYDWITSPMKTSDHSDRFLVVEVEYPIGKTIDCRPS
jgi:hypothetical protein